MPITTISTTTAEPAFAVAIFIRDAVAQKYGNSEICSIQDDDSQVRRMGARLQVGETQMRYLNDPVFHAVVEHNINAMRLKQMTAEDIKEAAGLAISVYELNTLYIKKEKNVKGHHSQNPEENHPQNHAAATAPAADASHAGHGRTSRKAGGRGRSCSR